MKLVWNHEHYINYVTYMVIFTSIAGLVPYLTPHSKVIFASPLALLVCILTNASMFSLVYIFLYIGLCIVVYICAKCSLSDDDCLYNGYPL